MLKTPFESTIVKISILLCYLGLLIYGTSCNQAGTSTRIPIESNKQLIQVLVRDAETQLPLKNVQVRLLISGQTFPMRVSDNYGLVTFDVGSNLLGETVEFEAINPDYVIYRQNVTLDNASRVDIYMVREGAVLDASIEEVNTIISEKGDTPTPDLEEVLPDEPTVTSTSTVTSTATPTETPTPTTTPTKTPSPSAPNSVTLTRREGADTVYILAGPDIVNAKLGTLGVYEVAPVLGRTSESEWLKIVNDSGIEGWVADCEVTLSSTNLSNVPVVWTDLVTARDCDGSPPPLTPYPPNGCVNVSMTRTDWPDREFDDILLSWSNVPGAATRLELWVTGPTNDGVIAYVIYPTFSDVNTPYEVELFKFEDGDFKPGATYTYVVRPYNGNNLICTTQGTFVP